MKRSSNIDEAQEFIINRALQPAIESPDTTPRMKNLTLDSIRWIKQFKRTGDLLAYMDRFRGEAPTEISAGLKAAGIPSYEDIHDELIEIFKASINDCTRLDDFVIGQSYTAYDIHIFAKNYDLRSGGIQPIGSVGNHTAVFIKATLTGGTYPNAWIEKGQRLRYFLKSIKGKFKESYQANRSIAEYPEVPVYAFVRDTDKAQFVLSGIFKSASIQSTPDGAKWFDLHRINTASSVAPVTIEEFQEDSERKTDTSKNSSQGERQSRLANAPKKPKTTTVIVEAYVRNPDVIVEVLERANGICEGCQNPAPFKRRRDRTPYLEVHHKIPLSLNGEDTVENAIALCPNCHRQEHYGPAKWALQAADLPPEIE